MEEYQAKEIIKMIAVCYPRFVEKKNDQDDPTLRLKLLKQKLMERSYQPTLDKVNKHIDTNRFEPTFADILPPKPYQPDKRWMEDTYD